MDQAPAVGPAIHYAYSANYDGKDVPVVGNPNADMAARTRSACLHDALVSKTRARGDASSRDDVQALVDRIAALEQSDRDTAELLTQVTAQIAALTTASEVHEARAQWLFAAAIVASVVSVVACGLALLAW